MECIQVGDHGFVKQDIVKFKRRPADSIIEIIQARGSRILLETLEFRDIAEMDEAFHHLLRGGKPIREEGE